MAILCTLLFLIKSILLKCALNTYELNSVELIINGFSIAGIVGLVTISIDASMHGIESQILIYNILAGIFEGLGSILIGHSVVTGIAGPASALASVQVIVQVILDTILFDQIPNSVQIIACAFGLIGSLFISIGPEFAKYLKDKRDVL